MLTFINYDTIKVKQKKNKKKEKKKQKYLLCHISIYLFLFGFCHVTKLFSLHNKCHDVQSSVSEKDTIPKSKNGIVKQRKKIEHPYYVCRHVRFFSIS